MNWFIAIPVGWAVVAVVLGLVIGNGIRIERGIEPVSKDPVGMNKVAVSKVGMDGVGIDGVGMDGAAVAEAGDVLVPAAADAVGSSAGEEWPAARARQTSLTGAR
jgi:hypothetical protein